MTDTPTFKELITDSAVFEAIDKLGFSAPTPVQAAVIPPALEGHDIIAQAKTGSGKTLAFVIPLLHKLRQAPPSTNTFAIIVTPTRELANQITSVIGSVYPEVSPVCLIGGVGMQGQLDQLNRDRRVLVGTPGRILDHLRQRHISLRTCQYFVVDEADQMFSMDFVEDVRAILSRLPDERQGLFVSATITVRVEALANSFLTEPQKIIINIAGEEYAPIDHSYYEVGGELTAKATALCDVIETQNPRSAIIFCNMKSETELVEVYLRRRGYSARFLNSDLTQNQRDQVILAMREGKLPLLVATDVAARGLDIEHVDLVVNYSIPEFPESYVHRTGRTGRAGRSGRAVSLVGPQDFAAFLTLRRSVGVTLEKAPLPSETDVTLARLQHFYEIVRDTHLDVQERDGTIARKMLQDLGNIEEPSEEIVTMVAKLCRFVVEHSANPDQLPAAIDSSARETSQPRRQHDRDRGGRRDRDRGGRGGGRGRDRGRGGGRGRR